jgi:hypothetical protein
MSEGFEEFLKKKGGFWSECRTLYIGTARKNIPLIKQSAVLLKDLGEFALGKLVEFVNEQPSFKENQLNHWYFAGKAEAFEEIAVGCLGKTEVERRLRELKEKQAKAKAVAK